MWQKEIRRTTQMLRQISHEIKTKIEKGACVCARDKERDRASEREKDITLG